MQAGDPDTLYEPADLMPRATELVLETRVIIYDALFLALAEYADTIMVTADDKLLRTLKDTGSLAWRPRALQGRGYQRVTLPRQPPVADRFKTPHSRC